MSAGPPVLQSPAGLEALAAAIFEKAGAPAENARLVARSLVACNLAGHDSHGVIRIKEYLAAIEKGVIDPAARPVVVSERGAVLQLDGRRAFGQVAGRELIQRLVHKARANGVSCGGLRNSGHLGRLGEYVELAAGEGCAALGFVNAGAKQPRLAPHGGAAPLFGTNPLAAAFPLEGAPPAVMDFSSAAVAAGKIRVALDAGESLPPGLIVDKHGRPSVNPADYYEGGMLLPAAGHKGGGLAVLVEILAGLLSGAGSPPLDGWGEGTTNGAFFIVIAPEFFNLDAPFARRVSQLAGAVRSVPASDPSRPVLFPGDPELETAARRAKEGIPLPAQTWHEIAAIAARLGISVEGGSENAPAESPAEPRPSSHPPTHP